MAAIAETHYVAVAPFHNGGPLATAFGIHLAAALPNFFIQQVPLPRSERDAAMRSELLGGVTEAGNDGFAPLVNQPGVGVHVNEPALAKYSEETV
jgi:galactonate dehydratase